MERLRWQRSFGPRDSFCRLSFCSKSTTKKHPNPGYRNRRNPLRGLEKPACCPPDGVNRTGVAQSRRIQGTTPDVVGGRSYCSVGLHSPGNPGAQGPGIRGADCDRSDDPFIQAETAPTVGLSRGISRAPGDNRRVAPATNEEGAPMLRPMQRGDATAAFAPWAPGSASASWTAAGGIRCSWNGAAPRRAWPRRREAGCGQSK